MARGTGRLAMTLADRAAGLVARAGVAANALGDELDAGHATVDNAEAFTAELREDRLAIAAALAPLSNLPLAGSRASSGSQVPAAPGGTASGQVAPAKPAAAVHETTAAAEIPAPADPPDAPPQKIAEPAAVAASVQPPAALTGDAPPVERPGARLVNEIVARRTFPPDARPLTPDLQS